MTRIPFLKPRKKRKQSVLFHQIKTKENPMITATVLADSISEHGNRISTFELTYPRYIHAEVMTHRVFNRNASSSRTQLTCIRYPLL